LREIETVNENNNCIALYKLHSSFIHSLAHSLTHLSHNVLCSFPSFFSPLISIIISPLPSAPPPSFVALAVSATDYDPNDRPLATDVVLWLDDLLTDLPDEPPSSIPPLLPIPAVADLTHNAKKESFPDEEISTQTARDRVETSMNLLPTPPGVTAAGAKWPATQKDSKDTVLGTLKMGWLYKRNRHGFRNWKKRWFVLRNGLFMWYSSHEDVFKGTSWGIPNGEICLKNCILVKGSSGHRFQILDTSDMTKTQDTRLANREVAALNEKDGEEWLSALESHATFANSQTEAYYSNIDRAPFSPAGKENRLSILGTAGRILTGSGRDLNRQMRESEMSIASEQVSKEFDSFDTVKEWLDKLGLPETKNLSAKFAKAKLDMTIISTVGLSEKDLDLIGVKEDFVRRLLLAGCNFGGYSNYLCCEVTGARDFGNCVVYRCISRYKLARSVVYLRYSDFVKLQAKFRQSTKDNSKLYNSLPSLPQNSTLQKLGHQLSHTMDANERRSDLNEFIGQLADAIKGDAVQTQILLAFIDLA
jgi:hypothetical protein